VLGLVSVVLVLAACQAGEPADKQSNAATFTNPVYTTDFPDPAAILVDGVYHAYSTNNRNGNVPLLTSTDLVHWQRAGDVLPQVGKWADSGLTWAPEVIRTAAGKYVLYYTARRDGTGRQCIGRAVADTPRGPFVDDADEPLVCELDEGGSIDASPFVDVNGSLYLYWKNDGNAIVQPTNLYGQRLSPDGLQRVGKRVKLLSNDAPWHGRAVEAPQMWHREGRYFLFYSGNAYDSEAYGVGYATCEKPLGPCTDAPENPILRTAGRAAGPGHSYLTQTPAGDTWMLYHAWEPETIGSKDPGRMLWLDKVDWVDGEPIVRGPTDKPQPLPLG